jgi:hypothetical protein
MRAFVFCLALVVLVGACSKKPADPAVPATAPTAAAPATPAAPTAAAAPTGPEVSGTYAANGKPAALTQVTAHVGEPFDDKPVTDLVFTQKDQGGDAKAADHASFGQFGDAIVIHTYADGTVIGAEVRHSGLKEQGSVSISGVLSIKDLKTAGGEISGHLTSGGDTDVFGQKLNVDLAFHTKAP